MFKKRVKPQENTKQGELRRFRWRSHNGNGHESRFIDIPDTHHGHGIGNSGLLQVLQCSKHALGNITKVFRRYFSFETADRRTVPKFDRMQRCEAYRAVTVSGDNAGHVQYSRSLGSILKSRGAVLQDGEAKEVHSEQSSQVKLDLTGNPVENSDHGPWSHIFREFIRILMKDYVLHDTHDGVSRSTKGREEDDSRFAEILSRLSQQCQNVFSK